MIYELIYIIRHFLTASYDGNLRLFDYSQKLLQTIPVHVAPITSAVFVQGYQSDDADTRLVATASHDLTARLTEITVTQADPSSSKALASLHLHTAPLTSISSSGTHLLTASADGLIGLWDTSIPINDEVPAEEIPSERRKRRKLDGDLESRPKRKAPTSVLKSHTARVSKAIFARDGGKSAVSAGFDSTVRTWDVENGVCTNTIVGQFNLSMFARAQWCLSRPPPRNLSWMSHYLHRRRPSLQHQRIGLYVSTISVQAPPPLRPTSPPCLTLLRPLVLLCLHLAPRPCPNTRSSRVHTMVSSVCGICAARKARSRVSKLGRDAQEDEKCLPWTGLQAWSELAVRAV